MAANGMVKRHYKMTCIKVFKLNNLMLIIMKLPVLLHMNTLLCTDCYSIRARKGWSILHYNHPWKTGPMWELSAKKKKKNIDSYNQDHTDIWRDRTEVKYMSNCYRVFTEDAQNISWNLKNIEDSQIQESILTRFFIND